MSSVTLWRLFVHDATICFYLIVLSILDTFILFTRSGNDWAKQVFQKDVTNWIRIQSEVSCQVFWFTCNLLLHLCSWILVLLCHSSSSTTAATTTATAPHRTTDPRTSFDRAKHSLLLLVLLLVCSNAHFFWTIGRWWPDPVNKGYYYCTFTPQNGPFSEAFRDLIWPVADLTLSFLGPDLIIFFLLICRRPSSSCCCCHPQPKPLLLRGVQPPRSGEHPPMPSVELNRIAVCLSVWGLVSNLPEAAYNVYEFVMEHCGRLDEASERLNMQRILAQTLTAAVRDLFFSAKIVAYVLLSQTFRRFVLQRFSCVKKKKKKKQNGGAATITAVTGVRRLTQNVIL